MAFIISVQACKTQSSVSSEPVRAEAFVAKDVLGQAIAKEAKAVSLAQLAKDPAPFMGKDVIVTGKVDSVCQHMGCWMTLKDENGEAFVRMAGHAFFIPKAASGRMARVQAKLVDLEQPKPEANCGSAAHAGMSAEGAPNPKMGCKDEAEKATGKPLAKLELEAQGVELQ
jgi:Rieske Fe-S protein